MSQRLPKRLRIHQSSEIRQILTTGRKYSGTHINLHCIASLDENNSLPARAGFLSPKRLGKAVRRNQVRRWMREIWRKHRTEITGSPAILLMGRTSAIHASYEAIHDDFLRLCRKARLLPPSAP